MSVGRVDAQGDEVAPDVPAHGDDQVRLGGGVTVAAGTVARGYSSALRRCMPVLLNKVPFINQSMVYGVTVVGYSSSRYNIYCREEHATFGAGLWFEEMWHHFLSIQSNSLVEPYQVHLFTRVSRYGIC